MVLVQAVEVVGLKEHVAHLEKCKAALARHAVFVGTGTEHIVHIEMNSDFPHEVHEVEVPEPVGIVHHLGVGRAVAEVDEAGHLLPEALAVVVDDVVRHHGAHVGPPGGVADHAGSAAN